MAAGWKLPPELALRSAPGSEWPLALGLGLKSALGLELQSATESLWEPEKASQSAPGSGSRWGRLSVLEWR